MRTFLEKADEYSEQELITSCRSLNERMGQLSGRLIRENNPDTQGLRRVKPYPKTDDVQIMKKELGDRIIKELDNASSKAHSPDDIDSILGESLDAWFVTCMGLAMKPMLFGLKLRTAGEIQEIRRHMSEIEPELAQYWEQIRSANSSEDTNREVQKLIEHISQLNRMICGTKNIICRIVSMLSNFVTRKSTEIEYAEYAVLEGIHSRAIDKLDNLQIILHWRALLHEDEMELDSYKASIARTMQVLQTGIELVFIIAGIDPPPISSYLFEEISNIVHDAAALSKCMKSAVFSQNVEIILVEPGTEYNEKEMKSADDLEIGVVKGMVKFGLRATDSEGQMKLLLKPEVLLTGQIDGRVVHRTFCYKFLALLLAAILGLIMICK